MVNTVNISESMEVISGVFQLSIPIPDNPLGEYLHSLEQRRRLPVGIVLPAHGTIFEDIAGRIEEIIQHHQERMTRVIGAIAAEPKTSHQIAEQLPWDIPCDDWA